MGIARLEQPREKPQNTPLMAVKRPIEPVFVAAKKFYQTNPKEALELAITAVFLVFSFIGELINSLPWVWYLVFGLWIIHYFELIHKIRRKRRK